MLFLYSKQNNWKEIKKNQTFPKIEIEEFKIKEKKFLYQNLIASIQ